MPGLQSSKDLSNVIRHTGLQLFNKMLTNWNEWNHLEKLQIRYPNLEKFRGRQDFPAPKRTPGYLHKGNGIMHVVSPSSAFPMSPIDGELIAVLIVKSQTIPGRTNPSETKVRASYVTFQSLTKFFVTTQSAQTFESDVTQKNNRLTFARHLATE